MDKNIKVLLVDDQEDFRQLMRFWLKSKGYSVIVAPDGESAIRMVKEESPDILFLDLNMPAMDGVETLKKIREFNEELPTIIISAYVDDPAAKKILSYGVSGIFYKSKNFEEALSLLESALRTHKKLKRD
ncbi:MAG: response regulator [Candidatus Omnitrophica bacterium]|nr:response regulator [Candidatus Omnitrophota bacterium]MBU1852737.1 response regulator [Candidatus Omnitrophota bacterium]